MTEHDIGQRSRQVYQPLYHAAISQLPKSKMAKMIRDNRATL